MAATDFCVFEFVSSPFEIRSLKYFGWDYFLIQRAVAEKMRGLQSRSLISKSDFEHSDVFSCLFSTTRFSFQHLFLFWEVLLLELLHKNQPTSIVSLVLIDMFFLPPFFLSLPGLEGDNGCFRLIQ